MAGTAQGDRARRDASGGPSGSRQSAGIGQFGAIQAVAPSLGVEVSPVNVRDAGEIERAIAAFARAPNGGLIVTASALATSSSRSDRRAGGPAQLPAVYSDRFFVDAGGLISYGPDLRRPVPARGRLRRSHPQGREAGRPAGAGADQVRAGDQPQDRQGARPRSAADAARPRRRGDRMMPRRQFISLLGGAAAAWPGSARAQGSSPPVIGFLRDAPTRGSEYLVAAFRRGLAEAGFADGNNVTVELGISEGKHELLMAKASEFASRPVALIMASATSATIAAARATSSVPIVFAFPADPI